MSDKPLMVSSVLPEGLFIQWKEWIERVRMELVQLRIMLMRFKELQHATEPYGGQEECAWNLADFMVTGFTTSVCVGIRRLAEVPLDLKRRRNKLDEGKTPPITAPKEKPIEEKDILSLTALLWEFQKAVVADSNLVTREKQQQRYRSAMPSHPDRVPRDIADRVHDDLAGAGVDVLQPDTIERDIICVEEIAKRITTLANKRFAHLSLDKEQIPKKVTFSEFGDAIEKLEDLFKRYMLGMFGEEVSFPFEEFSIAEDLERLWPRVDDRPSVVASMFHTDEA